MKILFNSHIRNHVNPAYFEKLYNPPLIRMFNPWYNEEEDDFLDGFDPWEGFSHALGRMTFIDFCLIQTQRWYEDMACNNLSMGISRKLCGNIKDIAVTTAKESGRLSAASIVFKASMELVVYPFGPDQLHVNGNLPPSIGKSLLCIKLPSEALKADALFTV